MNDQHLDFIPSDENEQEFTIFEEITEEEAERANKTLKDRPEPDYSAVVPPDDEDCVFGFSFEEEPAKDDDKSTSPQRTKQLASGTLREKANHYIPSTDDLEDEFGPMDEDDVPTFREIYMGEQDDDLPF